jgi:cellulose synthase/poly-beta-1,6-N-acetylglucosamine synthase-like glycosyltransferase
MGARRRRKYALFGWNIRACHARLARKRERIAELHAALEAVRQDYARKIDVLNAEIELLTRQIAEDSARKELTASSVFFAAESHAAEAAAARAAALEAPGAEKPHADLPPAAQNPAAEPPAAGAGAGPTDGTRRRLGDLLLEMKLVTPDQLQLAMEYQAKFGGRLGDLLVEWGFITEQQLKECVARQAPKGRLGDLLVQEKLITEEQLQQALSFQRKSGGLLGDILLALRMVEPDDLYRIIASQNNIGRIGREISFDSDMKLPEQLARELEAVVVHRYSNRYLVAVGSPLGPEQEAKIAELLGMPIEQVLATKEELEQFWAKQYNEEMMYESVRRLAERQPENSARTTITRRQYRTITVLGLLFAFGLVRDHFTTLMVLNISIQIFYFLMTVFKFFIIMFGSQRGSQFRFTPEEIAAIDERDLPVYTLLVPMYKESNVIPRLIENIESLDYPKSKLDVRLLIEQDDVEAIELLHSMKLPGYYTVLVVPDSLPKTKPKACNYGLIRAKGEYVVIYDAEDRPDPDQLKKVYLTFRALPEQYVCVQAKLNYFNSDQNLLTRWFTHEYSMWFELLLPGIMKLDVPIPLGGTSNHFKTSVLRAVDAWDPYNVTEDADLGIRLYKHGYKTAIVDSRTWEEANSKVGNWIRQRSRWIKGYMQTWLVHMRRPFKFYRELGWKGFWGFQVMVLATPMLPLLNPFYWVLLVLWYGWHMEFIPPLFPGVIYYLAAFEFLIGNFLFVYSHVAGVYWVIRDLELKKDPRFSYGLVKYALLTPIYWVLMSIAAMKAAWQLMTRPFYWEKTIHGLDAAANEADESGESGLTDHPADSRAGT